MDLKHPDGDVWETKEVVIDLDLMVTVPFLSTVPARASRSADAFIQERLKAEARDRWMPVTAVDFATLWKDQKVKYTQRGTLTGGKWHLQSVVIALQRVVHRSPIQ